jgi:hypothetical protein
MTALPTNRQSAILSGGGFSPWQAPLAALFGGLAAAGQPGGWNNFGPGVIQGSQNFLAQQRGMMQDQRAQDIFQMQREEHDAAMRRANQEEARLKATQERLRSLLNPPGQSVILGMGQTASAPQDAALFSQYAADQGIPPHARQAAMFSGLGYSDKAIERGLEPNGVMNLARVGEGGLGAGAGAGNDAPNTSQNREIMGYSYSPAQIQALATMAETDPKGVEKILQQNAFAQPEEIDAPTIKDFYEGDRIVQKQWNPETRSWDLVGQGQRWAPKAEGGGLSVDINGDGVPDIQMGNIKSQWQSQDNAFANRLDNSIVEMDTVEAEGYDPTATSAGGIADYVGQRSVGGLIGNVMTSDQGKRWYRSAKEALAVVLRKDTGAAVTDHEFELYGPLYIPMPWDDAGTKASKKQALLVMRNSLRQGIGQGQMPPPQAPTQTPAPTPTTPSAGGNPDDPLNLFGPQQ